MAKKIEDELEELASYLRIDPHDIDGELVRKGEIVWRVGRNAALAGADRDAAKDFVAQVEADVLLIEREFALKHNAKASVAEVQAYVSTNKKVLEAKKDYIYFRRVAAEYDALLDAFTKRSFALNKLADMKVAEYYNHDTAHTDKRDARTDYREEQTRRNKEAIAEERRRVYGAEETGRRVPIRE